MAVTFELPVMIEQLLRREWADFDAVAKEAALVELYRQAKLTHPQLAAALGLDRYAVEKKAGHAGFSGASTLAHPLGFGDSLQYYCDLASSQTRVVCRRACEASIHSTYPSSHTRGGTAPEG
jgi:hypothetical protein